jgi:predicted RNA-binding protein with PIN domain
MNAHLPTGSKQDQPGVNRTSFFIPPSDFKFPNPHKTLDIKAFQSASKINSNTMRSCHCSSGFHVRRLTLPKTLLSKLLAALILSSDRLKSCPTMALVRILVDGYSLLHNWPKLAPRKPRHSETARDELIQRLRLYQDAIGTPITIFFDGGGAPSGTPTAVSTPELEVLYSRSGQTADQMIERAAHRFAAYGEVMAVTDDNAERETVISLGGSTSSCWNFIQTVESTLAELADDIKHHNRQERHRFQKRR